MMTDVAVTIAPPTDRTRRSSLPNTGTHSDLYHALSADAVTAVYESGGALYLAIADGNASARRFAEELCETVLPEAESAPIIAVQGDNGEPIPAHTLGVLRERSEAASIGVLDSRAALVERTHLDTAAMRLRRDEITLGPTPTGHWYYFGTSLPLDALPKRIDAPIDALTGSIESEDRSVGFLPMLLTIDSQRSIAGMRAILTAMSTGKAGVAPYTTAWLESQ